MARISVKQGSAAAVTSTVSTGATVNNSSNTGNDVIRVLEAIAGETYNLYGGDGNDTITGGVSDDVIFGGATSSSSENFRNNLRGGLGNDQIYGEAGNDTIDGGEGNDSLYGLNGNDNIKAGLGEDFINEAGYTGNDTLDGGDGNDLIYGGYGNDNIKGGRGNDYIDDGYSATGDGNDTIDGGDGNDIIYSGAGNDSIKGGLGNDNIYTRDDESDTIDGGAGNDYIEASFAADSIIGGSGDDEVDGNDGNDTINGGDGNDSLYGGDGNDSIIGGKGNDEAYGGDGNDTINGGDGNDSLYGGDGNDTISAGNGNDKLYDGEDNDTLNGDAGNDYFYASYGNDVLNGGTGNDTFELYFEDSGEDDYIGNDTIDGGTGNDTVLIRNLSASNFKYTTATVNNVKTVTITNLITEEVQTIRNVEKFTFEFDDVTFNLSDLTHTGTATYFEGYSPEDTLIATPDNGATNDTTPTITLTAQLGSTVEIFVNDVSAGFATETGHGEYEFTFGTLAEGTYSITAVATTLGGEEIATSEAETLTLTVDTTAPNVTSYTLTPTISTALGTTSNDGTVNDQYINATEATDTTISGDVGSNGTGLGNFVKLSFVSSSGSLADPDATVDPITINADGTWSYDFDADELGLVDNTDYTVYVQILDAAGNVSSTSGTETFTYDVTVLGAVSISGFTATSLTFTTAEVGYLNVDTTGAAGLSTSATNTYTVSTNNFDQQTLTARDAAGNSTTVTYGGKPVVFAYGDQSVALTGSDLTDAVLFAYAATGEASSITGGNNNDYIVGNATGTDTLSGGAGDDNITGAGGNDTINGGAGNDTVNGGTGNDTVSGGDGNDGIYVYAGNNSVDGGAGDDEIESGAGNDTVSGGNGNDDIDVFNGNNSVDGGAGDDTVNGGTGNDTVSGGDGDDDIYVYAGNNSVDGGAGDDEIESGAGNDTVSGGDGNDYIDVFSGNNSVDGGDGDDGIYYTGSGENLISGGDGDDFLGAVDVNTSNDALFGGAGDDTIEAGAGSDVVGFDSNDGTDTVEDLSFDSDDKIVFFDTGVTSTGTTGTGSVNFAAAPTNSDTVYYFTSADYAYGGSYYEFATLTDLAITQSAVQQDNKVLVVNSTNEASVMETFTSSGLENAYILIQNGSNTEIWFDPNWGTTDARTLVATLVGVSTTDLDVTDFGIYSSETLTVAVS